MNRAIRQNIWDMALIWLGMIGLMGALFDALHFPGSALWSFVVMFLYSLWLYRREKKLLNSWKWILCLNIFIVIVLNVIPDFQEVLKQLEEIIKYDYFLRFDELLVSQDVLSGLITGCFLVLIGSWIIYSLVHTVVHRKNIMFNIGLYIVIFIFLHLIKHPIQSKIGYIFVLFIILLYAFGRFHDIDKCRMMTIGLAFVVIGFGFAFSEVFFASNGAFQKNTTTALSYITSYFNKDILGRTFNHQNTTGTNANVEGKLPDDDITLGQSLALDIYSSTPFDGYIRGYSLISYDHNEWKLPQDPVRSTSLGKTPSKVVYDQGEDVSVMNVKIDSKLYTDYQFTTYDFSIAKQMEADSYYLPQNNQEYIEYIYYDFENQNILEHMALNDSNYQEIDSAYLEIPEYLKPLLFEFIEQHHQFDQFDLTQFQPEKIVRKIDSVQEVLSREFKYDLKTGKLPEDQDFVEFFMNTSKKGSCTHFATLATLLLRQLNVPARYVTGYVVDSDDFKDGHASVYSNRAHAWVEVYCSGLGWIPFEMTPVKENEELPAVLDALSQDNFQQTTTPTETTTNPQTTQHNQEIVEVVPWYQPILKYQKEIMSVMGAILIILSIKACQHVWLYIILYKSDTCQKILFYYRRVNKLKKWGLSIDEKIVELMQEARFSYHDMSDDQVEIMKQYYQKAYLDVYSQQRFYWKILMKIILINK